MDLKKQLAKVAAMKVTELRGEYLRLFGDQTLVGNRQWLVKRISWRLQELQEGGLSERAKRRAAELANDADLRMMPPREKETKKAPIPVPTIALHRDPRLPMPGSAITRVYKGKTLVVTVTHDGFEYAGENYDSLSAVARTITGSHMNGYLFFGLVAKKGGAA